MEEVQLKKQVKWWITKIIFENKFKVWETEEEIIEFIKQIKIPIKFIETFKNII